MRIHHVLFAGLLTIGLVLAWRAPTSATTKFGERVAKQYKLDAKAVCALCHDAAKGEPGSKNLNTFGKDFDKASLKQKSGSDRAVKTMDAIAGEDADGDGATNMEEVLLGANPGDAKSVPAADKLAEYRKAHPKK